MVRTPFYGHLHEHHRNCVRKRCSHKDGAHAEARAILSVFVKVLGKVFVKVLVKVFVKVSDKVFVNIYTKYTNIHNI